MADQDYQNPDPTVSMTAPSGGDTPAPGGDVECVELRKSANGGFVAMVTTAGGRGKKASSTYTYPDFQSAMAGVGDMFGEAPAPEAEPDQGDPTEGAEPPPDDAGAGMAATPPPPMASMASGPRG